jgi:hypothetical protein
MIMLNRRTKIERELRETLEPELRQRLETELAAEIAQKTAEMAAAAAESAPQQQPFEPSAEQIAQIEADLRARLEADIRAETADKVRETTERDIRETVERELRASVEAQARQEAQREIERRVELQGAVRGTPWPAAWVDFLVIAFFRLLGVCYSWQTETVDPRIAHLMCVFFCFCFLFFFSPTLQRCTRSPSRALAGRPRLPQVADARQVRRPKGDPHAARCGARGARDGRECAL